MNLQQKRPMLFLDFDGTITERDVIDAILESFADSRWLEIEKQWRAGRIGSRDCLRAQTALVQATRAQIDELIDGIKVDSGFALLLETAKHFDVPAQIISDGFDYCIRRILERPNLGLAPYLSHLRVCASHLEFSRWNRLQLDFPFFHQACAHGCATCKPAAMRLLNRTNAQTIFVGDGLSDRYAAQCADLVFAKNGLASYCREQGIEFIAYCGLDEVASYLNEALGAGGLDVTNRPMTVNA